MAATNFDTFCITYRLIMLYRTLGKIPGISWMAPVATFICATRSCCLPTWAGFSCTPRNGNPMVSGQVSSGPKLLGLHVQSICCHVSKLVAAILSTFCKWIKWCLLTVLQLSPFLTFVVQTAYIVPHTPET